MHGVEKARGGSDFKTKKELKDYIKADPNSFRLYDTSMFNPTPDYNAETLPIGKVFYVAGPNVYRDRRWYAQIEKRTNGTIIVR